MAKFCKSQEGQLTIVFSGKEDLLGYALSITETMNYLVGKYGEQNPDAPIIVVLDIHAMDKFDGQSKALN